MILLLHNGCYQGRIKAQANYRPWPRGPQTRTGNSALDVIRSMKGYGEISYRRYVNSITLRPRERKTGLHPKCLIVRQLILIY